MTKAKELAAMRRLIDTFGAEIVLQHRPPFPRTPMDRASQRLEVEDAARDWHLMRHGTPDACTCRVDADGDDPHEPLMPEWSPYGLDRPGRIAVIGPGPTFEDISRGGHGYSRSERLLSDALRRAGIAREMVSWLHACWCWPQAGATGVRAPTPLELDAWHPWLRLALDAADVEYVLLHGAHALRAWRGDLTISGAGTAQYLWGERWWVNVIPHASNVMRRDGIPETPWREQVAVFVSRVLEGVAFDGLGTKCVECLRNGAATGGARSTAQFYGWDSDGVAYCEEHFEKSFQRGDKARKKSRTNQQHQQGAMEL